MYVAWYAISITLCGFIIEQVTWHALRCLWGLHYPIHERSAVGELNAISVWKFLLSQGKWCIIEFGWLMVVLAPLIIHCCSFATISSGVHDSVWTEYQTKYQNFDLDWTKNFQFGPYTWRNLVFGFVRDNTEIFCTISNYE